MAKFRQNRLKINRRNGFTLIEMMIAVGIIAVSTAAAYMMFEQGSSLIQEQYHRRLAFEKAQAFYEEIKGYRQSHQGQYPPNMPRSFDRVLVPPSTNGGDEGVVARYNVEYVQSIGMHPIYPAQPLFTEIKITYRWVERNGREYSDFINVPI